MRCDNCRDTGFVKDYALMHNELKKISNSKSGDKLKLAFMDRVLSQGVECPACNGDCKNEY